jgi:hypothetical protein
MQRLGENQEVSLVLYILLDVAMWPIPGLAVGFTRTTQLRPFGLWTQRSSANEERWHICRAMDPANTADWHTITTWLNIA